jgi:ribosomal protein S12 methylthiotransferase
VSSELKAERRARFMQLAGEISAARLKQKVGRKMQVLVDSIGPGNGNGSGNGNGNGHGGASGIIAIARSSSDAPEIDGTVRIAGDEASARGLTVGSMVMVQITGAGQYDLDARLLRLRETS